jgi:hypothetical protein
MLLEVIAQLNQQVTAWTNKFQTRRINETYSGTSAKTWLEIDTQRNPFDEALSCLEDLENQFNLTDH